MSFKIYKENFIDITTITIDANTKIRFIRDNNNNKILPNDRYLFVENILITELKLPQITVNMTNAILTINNKSGDGNVITIYSYNGDKIDNKKEDRTFFLKYSGIYTTHSKKNCIYIL